MFRKKDDEQGLEAPQARDEHAYEDNWYRSLKAMSERTDGAEELEERVEADAEDSTGTETPDVPDDAVDDEGSDSVAEPPDDLEARAGALLERLRALTHLADEESESSSARG